MEKENMDVWKAVNGIDSSVDKIRGIAGLIFVQEGERNIELTTTEANGVASLLQDIADEIGEGTEGISEYLRTHKKEVTT